LCETGYARSRQPSSKKEGLFMSHVPAEQPKAAQAPTPDFRITFHGTVTTITPLSGACREWLEANVEIEAWQRFGRGIALEPGYVEQVAEAMIEAGLVVEGGSLSEDGSGEAWSRHRGKPDLGGVAAITKIVTAVVLVLGLAACGHNRSAAYQSQLEADHQACLNGTTPNACEAYRLDVQKCSVLTGNPAAAGCY
jgi:hypothetical protein